MHVPKIEIIGSNCELREFIYRLEVNIQYSVLDITFTKINYVLTLIILISLSNLNNVNHNAHSLLSDRY